MSRNKIIVALLLGIIGLTTLSLSMSLAWYVSSSNLIVDNINITMKSDEDLTISYTGAEHDYVHDIVDTESRDFSPVSSMFTSSWFDENNKTNKPLFYHYPFNNVDLNGVPQVSIANQSENYYYQKDVYFYKTKKNSYLTIDTTNTSVKPNQEANHRRAKEIYEKNKTNEYTIEELEEQLNNLCKTIRISFLVNDEKTNTYKYFIYDPYKQETTYLAGCLDNDRTYYYDTYINDADEEEYEIFFGETEGDTRQYLTYDPILAEDYKRGTRDEDYTSFNADSKQGVHPVNLEESIAKGLVRKEENSVSNEDIDALTAKTDISEVTENDLLMPIWAKRENIVNKVTISIYMEGWDHDCINETMGAGFDIALKFKVLPNLKLSSY